MFFYLFILYCVKKQKQNETNNNDKNKAKNNQTKNNFVYH